MADPKIFLFLFGMNFVLSMTGGFAFPANENANQNNENLALPFHLFGYTHQDMPVPQAGMQQERPTNCYHFYVSQNMSSLLSEATKMLRQVRNKSEREWILTFIYRIKSLAEHLRSHPDSQNYEECLGVENDANTRSSILSQSLKIPPQQELYFEDDIQPNQNQKRSIDESESSKPSSEQASDDQETHKNMDNPEDQMPKLESDNYNSVAESTSESMTLKKDASPPMPSDSAPTAAISMDSELNAGPDTSPTPEEANWMMGKEGNIATAVISTEPDCLTRGNCTDVDKSVQTPENVETVEEDELEKQLHARRQFIEEERQRDQELRERIRKALLEELAPEIKKLRTVGGTTGDLIDLWNQSGIEIAKDEAKRRRENDFDYEEEGAAAGDLNSDKSQVNYRTIAPSSVQVENYRKPSDELPYDHSDELVEQLYDASRPGAPHYRSTRALDPEAEFLIISSANPFDEE